MVFRVYISSTRLDLAAECEYVKRWLTDNGYEPVDSYSPDSSPVLASCLADIDTCQLYVLLQGHRYGHRPPAGNPDNLSITHLEYRHARSMRIPTIVLQSARISNIALTDIRKPDELASVNGFWEEVAQDVRPALFADDGQLRAALRDGVTKEAAKLGLLPSDTALRDAFRRASRDLLAWPDTLPGGTWLERPELEILRQRVSNDDRSVTLLLGEPGCGKSALLGRLGREIQQTGVPVLGIKANHLPEEVHSQNALQAYVELPQPFSAAVHTLAQQGPVLVLLDQLDALADLVVQHSARLRVLLDLIRDLAELPNVHLVASCRSFEQRHDPGLRHVEAEPLELVLPPWEAVAATLATRGVQAGVWGAEVRETLRVPEALSTFLSLIQVTDEPGLEHGLQGMLQVQWERRVLSDATGARRELLLDLARRMAVREVLWQPVDRYADRLPTLRRLAADGLLRWEDRSGRVEFRHQTLFEFVRARVFLDQEGSLTDAVLANQGSLRIRPQLWHALVFLRRVAPDQYLDELHSLWAADLRRHLRMLIIEFLGMQRDPLPLEVRLACSGLDDAWFRRRFLSASVGSPGWFEQLALGHLPRWMAGSTQEGLAILPVLTQALTFAPDRVLELLDLYWLSYPDKDELSWRVLAMGPLAPRDPAWVDRLERILARTELAAWEINHAAGVVAAALPEQAPRLVAAWLGWRWRKAKSEMENSAPAADPDEAFGLSGTALGRELEALLQGRDLYDLPALAEAAPRAFVQAIWPLYIEFHQSMAAPPDPFAVGYRHSLLFEGELDEGEDLRLERPLRAALVQAVTGWAQADPKDYLDFVAIAAGSELLAVQRLLALGLVQCAAAHPGALLDFLSGDPRRLVLGPLTDCHQESRRLIQALAPHLDETQLRRLEQTLRGWHRYAPFPEHDGQTRRRLKWDREHRLRLLRALPEPYRSPALRRLLAEEERALPGVQDRDLWISGPCITGSPVSADQMARARDQELVHLFSELTDDTEWHHPRHRHKGGSIQAGRELAKLAEANPERALRLARQLVPGRNEGPVGEVLRALIKGNYPKSEIFARVEEFAARGFGSQEFRRDAAQAVEEAVAQDCPLPDSLLDLLEGWLVDLDLVAAEETAAAPRAEPGTSLLWGWGKMVVSPSGNYPVLAALFRACLVVDPPRTDRWLRVLETHLGRKESIAVWAAVSAFHLPQLRLADQDRAQAFLDQLFSAYPALLSTQEGVLLVGYIQRWIAPKLARAWLGRMAAAGPLGAQGYGEVLLLRQALFAEEDWPRQAIGILLASDGQQDRLARVGLAHMAVELWSEPAHRALAQGVLLRLLASDDDQVLQGLDRIFYQRGWFPDSQTRQLLDALYSHPGLLKTPAAERIGELLEPLVPVEPGRVARVCHALLDQVGDAMGNPGKGWSLNAEPLTAIALMLQDLGEPHRRAGLDLFERLLEFNLPQAQELALELDRRLPNQPNAGPPRRLRRVRRVRRPQAR